MRRYLLVLDMDLLALDEELDLGPINHLVGRQEQERSEQSEVVVLSLVATRQAKLSPLELLLGAVTSRGAYIPAKFPSAPQPGHDINAAAEHRMHRAVRHLRTIGYQASGLISDEELVKAVRAETRPGATWSRYTTSAGAGQGFRRAENGSGLDHAAVLESPYGGHAFPVGQDDPDRAAAGQRHRADRGPRCLPASR